jgi:hypothetical protein
MAVDGRNGRRSIGALLRDLAEGSTLLVRDEAKLVRIELSTALARVGRGTLLVATGAVFALLGGLALLTGFVLLVGDQWLPGDRYWVAALAVLVITGGCAAWLARRGLAHLSPSRLAPGETLQTIEENGQWLKRRLTSGATSS